MHLTAVSTSDVLAWLFSAVVAGVAVNVISHYLILFGQGRIARILRRFKFNRLKTKRAQRQLLRCLVHNDHSLARHQFEVSGRMFTVTVVFLATLLVIGCLFWQISWIQPRRNASEAANAVQIGILLFMTVCSIPMFAGVVLCLRQMWDTIWLFATVLTALKIRERQSMNKRHRPPSHFDN